MIFDNKELLNDIFLADETGEKYIVFNHSEKTWVLPANRLEPALEMYQPTTFKGKVLKRILPKIKKLEFALGLVGGKSETLLIKERVSRYIGKVINNKEKYYISVYMGDSSSEDNDKATLQIYDDEKILLYIKISKNGKATQLFDKEINALEYLSNKGIDNIPAIVSKEKIDGIYMFAQSTKKQMFEKVNLSPDYRHLEFVKNLVENTKKNTRYEDTDFYNSVQSIKGLSQKDEVNDVLKEAVEIVENRLKNKAEVYAFAHGDYTPWNIYYDKDKLCAFDFEYCSYSLPCYIDIFHYITQAALLGRNYSADKTINLYESQKELLEKYIENPDFIYLCYLIYIISFYAKRTIRTNKLVDKQYSKWILIVKYLIESIKAKD